LETGNAAHSRVPRVPPARLLCENAAFRKITANEAQDVGVTAELLKEVPAAETYRAKLEALETEVARLRSENDELRTELNRYIDRWETLDGDALETLLYLSRNERGNAVEIARANRVNIQIVETYLKQLVTCQYVHAHVNGDMPHFGIAHKGRWYLSERGLLKNR
jgi:predicted nuclease with TOPRIM domain